MSEHPPRQEHGPRTPHVESDTPAPTTSHEAVIVETTATDRAAADAKRQEMKTKSGAHVSTSGAPHSEAATHGHTEHWIKGKWFAPFWIFGFALSLGIKSIGRMGEMVGKGGGGSSGGGHGGGGHGGGHH